MNVLLLGVAVLLTIAFATGWVLLLSLPLIAASAATVGGVVEGAARVRRSWPALARDAARGILCIDGLASEPALAARLRANIVRVLGLAAPDTRARACACVRQAGAGFVGVLRVFNSKGHYLLRESGDTAAAVARRFSTALDSFVDTFPAREGARRVQCAECDPKTCPLRRRKHERVLATA